MKTRILIALWLTLHSATAFYFTGGPVLDLAKLQELCSQYITNQNLLNLLGQTESSAKDQLAALEGLKKTIGDGSKVDGYTMVDPHTLNAARVDAMGEYSKTLPASSSGTILKQYFERVNERDVIIAAYGERVRKLSAAQASGTTTLETAAMASSQLSEAGMDIRLNAITEAADSAGLHALQRQKQNTIRLQQMEIKALDAATAR